MNRVAVVAVTLLVVAGGLPVATALANGAQTTATGSGPEPGAVFAGVVGVQGAEVDSEISQRAFAQQFAAAESNDSKARVIAERSQRLDERLAELEAEKARLERAHENGSIGQAAYRARLAALAAQIRAVERQANRTATAAASLPEQSLRANGANVSQVRSIAQQAERAGGGEVAEAARQIAGEGVGNGLGQPNATERGPPENAGPNGTDGDTGPPDRGEPDEGNGTEDSPSDDAGPPTDAGPGDDENDTDPPNAGNATVGPPDDDDEGPIGTGNGTAPDQGNGSDEDNPATDRSPSRGEGNESDGNGTGTGVAGDSPEAGEEDEDESAGDETETDGSDNDSLGEGTETQTATPP